MSARDALTAAYEVANAYLDALPDQPVGSAATPESLHAVLGGALSDEGTDAATVVRQLGRGAIPGLVASAGPRYFGFVIGGSLPAALAADWLTSAWDQNAGLYVQSPAASVVEEIASAWLLDLFGLPAEASVGFVTGCQMANFTCLAAARRGVLLRAGWDVEARGLQGAPPVTVIVGDLAHATIFAALQLLGLGAANARRVPTDDQGRMRADALRAALGQVRGPTIVCAQAGEVNTGSFDPFEEIVAAARAQGAWVHVDGAFGLWAAVSGNRRDQIRGIERADSWTTDGHKWLNVPYDSGIVIVAHPAAHRAAMSQRASYLIPALGEERDGMDWTLEASRRARAVPIYAVLRFLGRAGLEQLVERCCRLAARIADQLRDAPGVFVLNDVVLNQVVVRFVNDRGENTTGRVIPAVQASGECWCGGTTWAGQPAMRVSVSSWRTTEHDADRSVAAILRAHRVTNTQP
jgi:glutamate/tyrosine decarboxylase-like PLP-dependent enzyme